MLTTLTLVGEEIVLPEGTPPFPKDAPLVDIELDLPASLLKRIDDFREGTALSRDTVLAYALHAAIFWKYHRP